jgi:Transglutaminase-like superfamily
VALSQYWLAARVGLFLCSLPLRLRRQRLPILLERLATRGSVDSEDSMDPRRVAELVRRVSRLRFFGLPIFPRECLRQSLATFSFLSRMGYPVEIYFGIRRDGNELGGHSWVVLDGRTLGEREPGNDFRTIFSYGADSDRSTLGQVGEPQMV